MDNNSSDEIVIAALLKRMAEQRLPRAMELKKKVFEGATLNESEMKFLETVFKDAQYAMGLVDKHPEHQEIVLKALQLYTDITKKALENEKNK